MSGKRTIRKSYDSGLATRRKVLGDEWVDRAIATATPFNRDFQEMITRHAWDDVWNRKGLSHPVRRMLVLAMTVAQGRWEEYRLHLRAALESGDLSTDDVKEVLMQAAIYVGVPGANTGFKEAREVIAELAARKKTARAAKKGAKKAKK
jgi:4-carboxymuconolactone decarboxylase